MTGQGISRTRRGHQYSLAYRAISSVVLSFFLWSFGGIFDIAFAIENIQKSQVNGQKSSHANIASPGLSLPQGEGKKPEEKFQRAIEDIEKTLADSAADIDTKKAKLKTQIAEIDALDVEIRKQFASTETKIKDLPEIVRQRHKDFVQKYSDN